MKAPIPDLDCIQTANYLIQGESSPGDRLYRWPGESLRFVDGYRAPSGNYPCPGSRRSGIGFSIGIVAPKAHLFFQDIAFLEGIKIETEIQLFNGSTTCTFAFWGNITESQRVSA